MSPPQYLKLQKSFQKYNFKSALPQRVNSARQCQNNWTGQSNQIRQGLAFTDAEHTAKIKNIERERAKMEAANHLMFVNCFMIEMLNDRQLY